MTVLSSELLSGKSSLMQELRAEGFQCLETMLGGAGVLMHDHGVPRAFEHTSLSATLRDGTNGRRATETEEGGGKAFLRAVGSVVLKLWNIAEHCGRC